MKVQFISVLIFMFAMLFSSCAQSPEVVALDYWKKRASLDLNASDHVSYQFRDEAKKEIRKAREAMVKIHPDYKRYRFDLSGVRGRVVELNGPAAKVLITGRALAYDHKGRLIDDDKVSDYVELRDVGSAWLVDYSRLFDYFVKTALNNLALAQDGFFRQHRAYAKSIDQLKGVYDAPDQINIKIIKADRNGWRALAGYAASSRTFMYDSATGGLAQAPLICAPPR